MKDPDEEEKQEFCWSFSSKGLDLLSHLELLSTNAVAPNEIEIPEPMVVECPTPSGSDLKSLGASSIGSACRRMGRSSL